MCSRVTLLPAALKKHMRASFIAVLASCCLVAGTRPWLIPQPFYSREEAWREERVLVSGSELAEEGSWLLRDDDIDAIGNAEKAASYRRVEVREAGFSTADRRVALGVVDRLNAVEYLRFCGSGLGDGLAALALRCRPQLLGLAVESDSLTRAGIDQAAATFPRTPVGETPCQLRELSLRRNSADGRALARLVRFYPELRALYLGANPGLCRDDGARAMCDVVARSTLETLELSECGLDDEGCIALARALRRTEVKFLDVSRNPQVTAAGLAALLKCQSLLSIDATGANVGDRQDSLAAALRKHPRLTHLSLADTKLTPDAAARILAALASSKRLEYLDLSDNPLTPLAASDLKNKKGGALRKFIPTAAAAANPEGETCALCAAAQYLRNNKKFTNLRELKLNDVGARKPHADLLQAAAQTNTPNIVIDLASNPLLLQQISDSDGDEREGQPPKKKKSKWGGSKDPPLVREDRPRGSGLNIVTKPFF